MNHDKETLEAADKASDYYFRKVSPEKRTQADFLNEEHAFKCGFLAGVTWREETILNDPFSKFDHPCKNTCSGWRQGYERGHQRFLNDSDSKWKVKFEESEKEIAKLKEQLKIAKGALERLEAGFAGMFGHQSVSPQQDFYDRGEQFVMDALKQLRDLEE